LFSYFSDELNHSHEEDIQLSHPKLSEIPVAEQDSILKAFFKQGTDGPLIHYPSQDKKKLVVLAHLAGMFESNRVYTALEVNQQLKSRFEDFATLRRDLVEFGFFERTPDGREYRRLV
jgi:hypothetical protein